MTGRTVCFIIYICNRKDVVGFMMIMFTVSANIDKASTDDIDRMIQKIAEGNTEALAELYRATDKAIFAYALAMLKNSHDAEDVLHDTYLSVCKSAASYVSQGKPLAYLFAITRNHCLKLLGKGKRLADIEDDDIERFIESVEDVSTDDKLILDECLSKLGTEERQIVVMHAVWGFKHREIAELLGTRMSTVISKYNRAIKKLKNVIEESGGVK